MRDELSRGQRGRPERSLGLLRQLAKQRSHLESDEPEVPEAVLMDEEEEQGQVARMGLPEEKEEAETVGACGDQPLIPRSADNDP